MPVFAQITLARVLVLCPCIYVSFWLLWLVFQIADTLLEGNSALTRRGEEGLAPDKNWCLFCLCNGCFNFFFLQTERIYFQVFLPKGSKEKSKPMFFCHRWSIGKAIDFAASLASLKNDNNKLTAKVTSRCNIISIKVLWCSIQACSFTTVWLTSAFTEIKAVSHCFRRSLTFGSYFGNLDC